MIYRWLVSAKNFVKYTKVSTHNLVSIFPYMDLILKRLVSNKMSYILKQTGSFQQQI